MELYSKVLDQLKVSDKNILKYLRRENLAVQNDSVVKLIFSSKTGNEEFILVNNTGFLEVPSAEHHSMFDNLVLAPIFSINHNNSFVVFRGENLKHYRYKDYLDVDHIMLLLKTFATLHSKYLSTSSAERESNNHPNFAKSLEAKLNSKKHEIGSVIFEKFNQLIKTLDTKVLVPSVGNFETNVIFFKYDFNEKPVDCKILVSSVSPHYLPPLFDMIMLIFAQTNEDDRKEHLQELLQFYYNQLTKNMQCQLFSSEEFLSEIRNFLSLMKLFSDDLDIITEFLECPGLLREECYEILYNYLGHAKYYLKKFFLTSIPQRSGNLGDYYKLKMEILVEEKDREVNLFVKFLPSNNEATSALVKSGPSKKEDFFYNFFIKEFEKCGLGDFLNFAPTCYLSKPNYVLVLEDLALQNYRLNAEGQYFSYEMLRVTMKTLAHLHGCSLVFEETKSKELGQKFRLDEHYEEYLQEILFQTKEENETKLLADVGEEVIINYLIYLYPEVCTTMTMEEFHRRSELTFKSFYQKIMKSDQFRNTLCHGDTWATNIMFKFDSNNSPIDCKLVDFQLTRYCPPVQDLLSCIYLTTVKDTRTKYLTCLLEEYYSELSKIVATSGFDMEEVISKEEFKKSCEYMKSQAICQALFYGPINLTSVEDRVSIFSDPENFEKIMKNDRRPFIKAMMGKYPWYKVRLGELVYDLYDVCENKQY